MATRRRWREEVFPAVILLGVFALHGYSVLRIPSDAGVLYLSILYLLALFTALFLPIVFHGSSVLGTLRFDLLPYVPHYFFLLRLLFGQPLRVLLTLSTVSWTIVGLLRLPLGGLHTLLALLQLLGWTIAAAIVVQIIEDTLLRRHAIKMHTLLSGIGVAAVSLLMSYGSFFRDIAGAVTPLVEGSALLLGSRAVYEIEVLISVVALGTCAGAVVLGGRVATQQTEPAPPPRQLPLLTWLIASVSSAVAPKAPASFGKELASVLRYFRIASGLIWPFLLGILAFSTGNPFLLIVTFPFWALHTFNLLGVDLPLQGMTRYRLLIQPVARVLWLRHAAMLSGITVAALAAALLAAVFGRLALPEVGPPSMIMYPLTHLYGASLFLLASVLGNRLSIRYPYWYDLSRRARDGVQSPSFLILLAMTSLALLAILIVVGASILTRTFVQPTTEVVRVGSILVLSTLTHLLLYAGSIRSRSLRV